jgi:hypothetical protein
MESRSKRKIERERKTMRGDSREFQDCQISKHSEIGVTTQRRKEYERSRRSDEQWRGFGLVTRDDRERERSERCPHS